MGRDHCIFANAAGYVRYYRDPHLHPKRHYIGVALDKDHVLPSPRHAARRRRLNMLAVPMTAPAASPTAAIKPVATDTPREATRRSLTLRKGKGYAYREANWQIGRAAENAGVQVQPFVRGDRWTAWRRSKARIAANEENKRLRDASKKKAKPKPRQPRVIKG